MKLSVLLALALVTASAPGALGGPLAYAICQTGCNVVAVACYAAAGAVFGTIAAPAAPAAIVGCNGALGTCMAACALAVIAPTP